MIPHTETHWQTLPWQQQLREAFRTPGELLAYLGLPPTEAACTKAPQQQFPMLVPRDFARRMAHADPHDPLLLQVLPDNAEVSEAPGFVTDPLAELSQNPRSGVIHKYHNRALLLATGSCAVNCRYCFRQHFDYQANQASSDNWQASLAYLKSAPQVEEVILSGGDPLLLADKQLQQLIEQLATIPHLRRLRIHTRLPIVLPARTTAKLCELLRQCPLPLVLVLHCNHPNELDNAVTQGLSQLSATGVTLLNQSVLLRGINDCAQVLNRLSNALFDANVMPYYLHLLDRVQGAAHFEVAESRALEIYRQLLALNSGYLIPRLVRENPAERFKLPVSCHNSGQ